MVKITYIAHDGGVQTVDARLGASLMEVAVKNNIQGIAGDCGGACACATCHVYVHRAWVQRIGDRSSVEEAMLEFAEGVEANSRLACQITVGAALDGLVVHLPPSQH